MQQSLLRLLKVVILIIAMIAIIHAVWPPEKPGSAAPPILAPFGDGTFFVIVEDLEFTLGNTQETITIPRGFVTDLASVPRLMWSLFPKTGNYMSAAILHDYLYANQSCTKAQADLLLKMEMESFGVSKFDTKAIYQAVKLGGASSWQENKEMLDNRVIRIVPEFHLKQFLKTKLDATQSWETLKGQIMWEVKEIAVDIDPKIQAACTAAVNSYVDSAPSNDSI